MEGEQEELNQRHASGLHVCSPVFKEMPCTQCEVLDVGKYSDTTFGPFRHVFGSVPRFFLPSYAFEMWHICIVNHFCPFSTASPYAAMPSPAMMWSLGLKTQWVHENIQS